MDDAPHVGSALAKRVALQRHRTRPPLRLRGAVAAAASSLAPRGRGAALAAARRDRGRRAREARAGGGVRSRAWPARRAPRAPRARRARAGGGDALEVDTRALNQELDQPAWLACRDALDVTASEVQRGRIRRQPP